MIRFITSLTFLYAFSIFLLIVYGILYYRYFVRNRRQPRLFPWVFGLIGVAALGFLWMNMSAPLSLHTITNLDHHFLRLDGFKVKDSLVIGRTDTIRYPGKAYNAFRLYRKDGQILLRSSYAEEPFYIASGDHYSIASRSFEAPGHALSFQSGKNSIVVSTLSDTAFRLKINEQTFVHSGQIRKGSTVWNQFKDDPGFLNSLYHADEQIMHSLQSLYWLRDDVSRDDAGSLHYFISGKYFASEAALKYDQQPLNRAALFFEKPVPENSSLAWGIGFLDNNRNQFRIRPAGADSFYLQVKYPVSYPLTEADRNNFEPHPVTRFLVSNDEGMRSVPAVFQEGFLFTSFAGDSALAFAPVLLQYNLDRAGTDPQVQVRSLYHPETGSIPSAQHLELPAQQASMHWEFSIQNSFVWNLGSMQLPQPVWMGIIFGTLLLFIVVVLLASLLTHPAKLSWIWQLLSVLSLVMLTTRFLLYWRYKSFPPYEGMDLPSVQQLNSLWNFGVIVGCSLLLTLVLGSGLVRKMIQYFRAKISGKRYHPEPDSLPDQQVHRQLDAIPFLQRIRSGRGFLTGWILILCGGAATAAVSRFEPTVCRHLAVVLVLFYFLFSFISYYFSPLVNASARSWWSMSTDNKWDMLISNPVKLLLSVSLLAVYTFVDIGFAIVFLNFLLFQEAFLCINYAFAGLSAGSRTNAKLFGGAGIFYTLLLILNLIGGPYIFRYLLNMPLLPYLVAYAGAALLMSYLVWRLLFRMQAARRRFTAMLTATVLFAGALLFFPRERILDKAAITRYRIDVMTMPVDKAIEVAYAEGKNYEPVIRAAQNQWFINTFIYDENNPAVNESGFHLLPHAPQNKGARYNAQATDLVTSRFFIAEHGKWSVLLYVLLLLLPASLLASFYKLYPDFTSRVNGNYPVIITGFAILNYLCITALLVILAATGRYIFFGQDLPFGSILSKQSILFPTLLLLAALLLFRKIPLEQYPNRRKFLPGAVVFGGLAFLLIVVKPVYNTNKQFRVEDYAGQMDNMIQSRLQPVLDYFDTTRKTKRLALQEKDKLFSDSVSRLLANGELNAAGPFFVKELGVYLRGGFSRHLDQARLFYLDMNSGHPQLAVNDNFFRVEAPPHLQQFWTGNIYGDTSVYQVTAYNRLTGETLFFNSESDSSFFWPGPSLRFAQSADESHAAYVINAGPKEEEITDASYQTVSLRPGDSLRLRNPVQFRIRGAEGADWLVQCEPAAFMKNYYVNGSRYYYYPMGADFIWARHLAESLAPEYTAKGLPARHAFISPDALLMDSLQKEIAEMIQRDTSYHKGAEYAVCMADGHGRLLALADGIAGFDRPDPNDKAGFYQLLHGENGLVSQSLLRKQIGNLNFLRMNPGPGSTLKPIVFSAVASQLPLQWNQLSSEGFSEKQTEYGGERVASYDFEKNNGRISTVKDYLRYSDNYYHSNVLLLGSYPKQPMASLLAAHFTSQIEAGVHWPLFHYNGKSYHLSRFENWPGFQQGQSWFGNDSSFLSVGLNANFGICTRENGRHSHRFCTAYDSLLFKNGSKNSGYLLPEFALFDQQGAAVDHHKPNEVFMECFRGHVKGSSQVMIPPVKMLEAFGKLVSQNRNYTLTLNPWATDPEFAAFRVDPQIPYNDYLSLIREDVLGGMQEVLKSGTAARLGSLLKDEPAYFYYAKTGTTGDDERNAKSKLFALVISKTDLTKPENHFRKNKFVVLYFMSQNGPAKQNEVFQRRVVKMVEESGVFKKYMNQ